MVISLKRSSSKQETQNILDSIRCIVQTLRVSSRKTEEKLGISAAQLFVLQRLDSGSPVSINEIAERTFTHQSSVSVVISRLVKQGLVCRTSSKEDARRLDIRLSAKGRAFLQKSPRAIQEVLITAIEEFPRYHRRQLNMLLAQIVDRAVFGKGKPALFFEENN